MRTRDAHEVGREGGALLADRPEVGGAAAALQQ